MKATVLQLPARWNQPDQALAQIDELLTHGTPTDLVLLPEACLTGYLSPELELDLTPFAEPLDGPTAQRLSALAVKHHTHLIGQLIERDGDACYNAMIGFDPSGRCVVHYRKRHPWVPETWATPSDNALPLLEIDGHTVCLAVCFDLHFLRDESAAELTAADTLLFASAWVDETDALRLRLLTGLATDFTLNVVNANWGPGSPRIKGQGNSLILDPSGRTLARGGPRLDASLGKATS